MVASRETSREEVEEAVDSDLLEDSMMMDSEEVASEEDLTMKAVGVLEEDSILRVAFADASMMRPSKVAAEEDSLMEAEEAEEAAQEEVAAEEDQETLTRTSIATGLREETSRRVRP